MFHILKGKSQVPDVVCISWLAVPVISLMTELPYMVKGDDMSLFKHNMCSSNMHLILISA